MQKMSVVGALDERQSRENLNIFVKTVKKAITMLAQFLAVYFVCLVTSWLLTIIFKQPVRINLDRLITDGSSNLVANDLWNCLNYILNLRYYINYVAFCVGGIVLFVSFVDSKFNVERKDVTTNNGVRFQQTARYDGSVFSYKQHVCFLS